MKVNGLDVVELVIGSSTRQELWERFLSAQHVRVMAEIGVWKGEFAAYILRSVGHLETYYMIDPWANLPDWNKPFNVNAAVFDQIFDEMNAATAFARQKCKILRGRTKEVISMIPDESLDFAYIDGDHTLRGITIDLIKIWPKIKAGGFIGGDDFINTPWQHDVKFEPTLVFPFSIYFAEAMNVPIVALEHGQFILKKEDSAGFYFQDPTGQYGNLSLNKLKPTSSS